MDKISLMGSFTGDRQAKTQDCSLLRNICIVCKSVYSVCAYVHGHVCMYVCMHACMHACMPVYVCMYVCIMCMYVCMCVCMCVCVYVCMYVGTYVRILCMYVCVRTYVCTYVRTYVCMNVRMYVCVCVCVYVCNGKAIHVQAWTNPVGSSRLRLQISRQSAQEGGKVCRPNVPIAFTHQQMFLVLISVTG